MGVLAKLDGKTHNKQILTSSTDGNIKIWNAKRTFPISSDSSEFSEIEDIEAKWSIELIYTV